MPKTLAKSSSKDDYFALVRTFPLKKFRSEAEHAQALEISGRLIGRGGKFTAGQSEYRDALVVLIREFERARHQPKLSRASGLDVLKHLMGEHRMTQKQLAQLLGIGESASSMILSGDRELTKSHIEKLSRYFGVGVAAFFGEAQCESC